MAPRFDRKDVPRYNMLTVTTDPDLNRNVRFRRFTARELYGHQVSWLPRTALDADFFLVSEPNSKTYRRPSVMAKIKNIGIVLDTTSGSRKQGWKKRLSSGDSLSNCSRVSMIFRKVWTDPLK